MLVGCGVREPSSTRTSFNTSEHSRQSADSASGMEATREIASAPQSLSFVDVAAERGLKYVWPNQPRPMTALDAFGAGCAAFDYDNDGWQDVLLVGNPFPVLFRNAEGTRFQDVTDESGLKAISGRWTGCAVGDYDGDGLLDLLLTGYHKLALFKNVDGRQFQDVTAAAGLDPHNQGCWGSSCAFMDLDGDRWLDLIVLNYVIYGPDSQKYCEYSPGVISGCGPKTYAPERGRIWRNTGTRSFELVPQERGMQATHGWGLVLAFTDIDDDGQMDFYIGNDIAAADFLHNQGGMKFKNIAPATGLATAGNGENVSAMGADWADFNRDGQLDLAVSNWGGNSFVLFKNLGNQFFADFARMTGVAKITKSRLGFGTKWIDFENDGWPDLCFVNGHVYDNSDQIKSMGIPFRQQMCLCWNDRGREFIDVAPSIGARPAAIDRGPRIGYNRFQ